MSIRTTNPLAILGRSRGIGSRGRKRAAAGVALCAVFSVAPVLVGTGAANASYLVPCWYGPVESRLEVDCENRDFTPATVKIDAWCSNFAYTGWQERMAPQGRTHVTRDCGPGAHPVVWFVGGKSDWEELNDRLDELERDRDSHRRHRNRHDR
ncbi:hypothetical protein OHA40_21730 [Nocardia sp. NBC_00508]|uniref:hypothetical protein n=1 Tax=Nocardia sp. NBC_00508 TaxID=2975992 RepID=UPI002E7FE98B|nr:hypothetical protein [Nocardia sp. NBC_00508]WUD64313.1 hypothetical protein OHA40_21730 [Nocardia sp. NBC_00508]